jgi:predicted tellurium resistance membrane protein TerC
LLAYASFHNFKLYQIWCLIMLIWLFCMIFILALNISLDLFGLKKLEEFLSQDNICIIFVIAQRFPSNEFMDMLIFHFKSSVGRHYLILY